MMEIFGFSIELLLPPTRLKDSSKKRRKSIFFSLDQSIILRYLWIKYLRILSRLSTVEVLTRKLMTKMVSNIAHDAK